MQQELVSSGIYTFCQTGIFFINTIGEEPKIVAEDLVPKLREIGLGRSGMGGSLRVEFLTLDKLLTKLYKRIRFGRVYSVVVVENIALDRVLAWSRGIQG